MELNPWYGHRLPAYTQAGIPGVKGSVHRRRIKCAITSRRTSKATHAVREGQRHHSIKYQCNQNLCAAPSDQHSKFTPLRDYNIIPPSLPRGHWCRSRSPSPYSGCTKLLSHIPSHHRISYRIRLPLNLTCSPPAASGESPPPRPADGSLSSSCCCYRG